MPSLADIVGPTLTDRTRQSLPTADALAGDGVIVGLYFSAYCPPGPSFNALLVNFYNRFNEAWRTEGSDSMRASGGSESRRFKIVFVSSDEDEESFDRAVDDMPWLAIPFCDRRIALKLHKRYRILSLPSLVLLNGSTGTLITANGRDCLSDDLEGRDFPWTPQSIANILRGDLMSEGGSGVVDAGKALEGKITGFYFAAHWCPPCRSFTPLAVAAYQKAREAGHQFEMIFVSSDRSEDSYGQFLKTMPWLALPYHDPRVKKITRRLEVEGIPTLVLVDVNGEVITYNARSSILSDPEAKKFPWARELVEELTEDNSIALSQSACLILFTDGDPDLISRASNLLSSSASQYAADLIASQETEQELPELKFFYEGPQSEEIADSVRAFHQLDGRDPVLAIVDISAKRTYSAPYGDVTRESLDQLISDFKRLCAVDDAYVAVGSGENEAQQGEGLEGGVAEFENGGDGTSPRSRDAVAT